MRTRRGRSWTLGLAALALVSLASLYVHGGRAHDLADAQLFDAVVRTVERDYVDPQRINPRKMLKAALESVERAVPEVLVDLGEDAGSSQLTVTVGTRRSTFSAAAVSERRSSLDRLPGVMRDVFGYLQRCFPEVVSKVDFEEAMQVGREAAKAATLDERPNASVIIKRTGTTKTYLVSYGLTDLATVAGGTTKLPDEFINAEGNGITEAFRDYATPLVGRLPRFGWLKDKPIS